MSVSAVELEWSKVNSALQQLLSHEPDVCALYVPWHLGELSRGTCIRGQEDCPRGCKNTRQKRGRVANVACCLAFLGVTEVTVPDDSGYNSSVHLSFSDIMIDDHDLRNPMMLQVSQ